MFLLFLFFYFISSISVLLNFLSLLATHILQLLSNRTMYHFPPSLALRRLPDLHPHAQKAQDHRQTWKALVTVPTSGSVVNSTPRTLGDLVLSTRNQQQETAKSAEDAKARRRRIYRLASEEHPVFPVQTKNFFNYVMENKEIIKSLSLLGNCIQAAREALSQFLQRWEPYKVLWDKDQALERREALNAELSEFESKLSHQKELEAHLEDSESGTHILVGCIAISLEKLKLGLVTELKSSTHRIGQCLKKKYRREMDYAYAVINEMDRKLDRPIRDLDDVRLVMETLKKIRDQEVDMDLRIDPIEVRDFIN